MPSSGVFPLASAAAALLALAGTHVPVSPAGAWGSQEETEDVDTRPADLAELLAWFAAMPGLEVRFREEKHLALLAVPLRSEGRIWFLPPGWLTREVTLPEASRLAITPTELTLTDRDGTSTLDLRQDEELRAFVTSLVKVFAGDREALERSFTLEYEPDAADQRRWTFTLEPRAKPLTDMMRSLVLRGTGRAVTEIELREPNGDRTVTTVVGADPRRRFSPEEKERLFGIARDG